MIFNCSSNRNPGFSLTNLHKVLAVCGFLFPFASVKAVPIQSVPMAAAADCSLIIKEDNSLWGFGFNGFGSLGLGSSYIKYPTLISASVAVVSAEQSHSLYVKKDGTLWGMGFNGSGQLTGSSFYYQYPIQIDSSVATVDAGASFTLYLKQNGSLWAIGSNNSGQFGNGTKTSSINPISVAIGIKQVSAGQSHSVFIKDNDTLWTTGSNGSGELGDGSNIDRSSPVEISANVKSASAGNEFTLFIKSDDTLWGMGENSEGQLGIGDNSDSNLPVEIASDVKKAVAGNQISFFIRNDDTLWAMGTSTLMEFATGYAFTSSNVPVLIASNVADVAVGQHHVTYYTTGGEVYGFGENERYECGVGFNADIDSPVRICRHDNAPELTTHVNWQHLSGNSVLFEWAENGFSPDAYRITMGTTEGGINVFDSGSLVPSINSQTIPSIPDGGVDVYLRLYWEIDSEWNYVDYRFISNWSLSLSVRESSIGTGELTTFYEKEGNMYAVGANQYYGQLGIGDDSSDQLTPVLLGSGIAKIDGGAQFSLLLKDDGSLWAMGRDWRGQLGYGSSSSSQETPVFIMSSVVDIACGREHSLVLKSDGSLWGMGYNLYGQVGIGNTINQDIPVFIASGVKTISAGADSSIFVKQDGTLWGMGRNLWGNLATGSSYPQLIPVLIDIDVAKASTNVTKTAWVKTDGTLWVAGENGSDDFTPVQVDSDVLDVKCANTFMAILESNDSLWLRGISFGSDDWRYYQIANNVSEFQIEDTHLMYRRNGDALWGVGGNSKGQLTDETQVDSDSPKFIRRLITIPDISNHRDLDYLVEYSDLFTWESNGVSVDHYRFTIGTTSGATDLFDSGELPASTTRYNAAGLIFDGNTLHARLYWEISGTWYSIDYEFDTINELNLQLITQSLSANLTHSMFLKNGNLWGMGLNSKYELATGDSHTAEYPVQSVSGVDSVYTGNQLTFFIKNDGSLWGIGENSRGQLSDGSTSDRMNPVLIRNDVVMVESEGQDSVFLRKNGTLWISDRSGGVDFIDDEVISFSRGSDYTLWIKTDETLWAMGRNSYGQLGDGTRTDRWVPVQIASDVQSVAANGYNSFFISDGDLYGFGINSDGLLGIGSHVGSTTPVNVASEVDSISVGNSHSLFLKSDGTLWGMGLNSNGQLGTDALYSSYDPIRIESGVSDFIAGNYHSLFVKDGFLWGCGKNNYGQLGIGSYEDQYLPVIVTNVDSVSPWDLNMDNHADLLGQHTTSGAIEEWYLDGGFGIGSTSQTVDGAEAPGLLVSTADMNGDGINDYIWTYQEGTRQVVLLWEMNLDRTLNRSVVLGKVTHPYEFRAMGDMNSDGNADILWQDINTGKVIVWHMNGAGQRTSFSALTGRIPIYQIQAVADMNGDGYDDIIWQGRTGVNHRIIIWYMDGAGRRSSWVNYAAVAKEWSLCSAADYNNDSYTDIIWFSQTRGQCIGWLLDENNARVSHQTIATGLTDFVFAHW